LTSFRAWELSLIMLIDLLYFFVTFFITFLLYPFWINFVYRFQMGEEVRTDGPETHLKKRGTPTMGGLVFLITVSIITFIFNRSRTQTLFPLFVSALAGLFGILEDLSKVYRKSGLPNLLAIYTEKISRKLILFLKFAKLKIWSPFVKLTELVGSKYDSGLKTHQKFLIQGSIAGFVALWAYIKLGWDYIWFPLVGDVHIGILYPIVIFFIFMAMLNFVAFTDGLDGLAGGLSFIAICAYWVIAVFLNYNSLATFSATLLGALLPFLYFNIYPARIFMGNVGSHVLGAVLVVLAIVMHREIAMFIICGVFLFDGLSSPLQQFTVKLTKKRLFLMAPFHHHFELLGWPETKVTMRFWLAGIFFAFLGVFVALL